MSAISPNKEEFMTACMADGTDKEVCEARWKAANNVSPDVPAQTSPPADSAVKSMLDELKALRRENAMLRAENDTHTKHLRQAVDIAERANDQAKAREEAEKQRIITSIMLDCPRSFSKDELNKQSLSELQLVRTTIDKSFIKDFASIAADIDAEKKRVRPQLTAGAWDREQGKYVGGT